MYVTYSLIFAEFNNLPVQLLHITIKLNGCKTSIVMINKIILAIIMLLIFNNDTECGLVRRLHNHAHIIKCKGYFDNHALYFYLTTPTFSAGALIIFMVH